MTSAETSAGAAAAAAGAAAAAAGFLGSGLGAGQRPSKTAVASVGSRGDSYDNALAEALNSLFKAEVIRNLGPWKGIDDVEIATAEWVHWFNTFRPHLSLGGLTPQAFREAHQPSVTTATEPTPETLNAR